MAAVLFRQNLRETQVAALSRLLSVGVGHLTDVGTFSNDLVLSLEQRLQGVVLTNLSFKDVVSMDWFRTFFKERRWELFDIVRTRIDTNQAVAAFRLRGLFVGNENADVDDYITNDLTVDNRLIGEWLRTKFGTFDRIGGHAAFTAAYGNAAAAAVALLQEQVNRTAMRQMLSLLLWLHWLIEEAFEGLKALSAQAAVNIRSFGDFPANFTATLAAGDAVPDRQIDEVDARMSFVKGNIDPTAVLQGALGGEVVRASEKVRTRLLVNEADFAPAWRGNQFFSSLYTAVSAQPRSYPLLNGGAASDENMNFERWFNYYFHEAFATLTNEDRGRLYAVVIDQQNDTMLQRVGNAPGLTLQMQAGFAFPVTAAAMSIRVKRQVLSFLLGKGFRPVETTKLSVIGARTNAIDPKDSEPVRPDHYFCYRGDNRDPNTIVQHGGVVCRLNRLDWRQRNLDTWHPWYGGNSDAHKMWGRTTSEDNDYFSANSMTHRFHIACAYPMFKIAEIDPTLPAGGVHSWTLNQRLQLHNIFQAQARLRAELCYVVNRASGQWEIAIKDRARLYILALPGDTDVAKTYLLANPRYPEAAFREATPAYALAAVNLLRYQVPPDAGRQYMSTASEPSMTIKVENWEMVRIQQPHLGARIQGPFRFEYAPIKTGFMYDGGFQAQMRATFDNATPFDITHTAYRGTNTYYDVSDERPCSPTINWNLAQGVVPAPAPAPPAAPVN